jgi:hypothetical protein
MIRIYFIAFFVSLIICAAVGVPLARREMAQLDERWVPRKLVVARDATAAGAVFETVKVEPLSVPLLYTSGDELDPDDASAFAGKKLRVPLEPGDVLRRGYFSDRDECLESVRAVAHEQALDEFPGVQSLQRALERDR